MSRLLSIAAALWALAHPSLALARDWEFYGGGRGSWGADGYVHRYTGGYSARVTESGPNGRPPEIRPLGPGGHPWQDSTGLHVETGFRYRLLTVEFAFGIDSVTSGTIARAFRYEGAIGLRAPSSWHLGYESSLFSAFPSVLVGAGYGEMRVRGSGYSDFYTRSGACALASVRYDLRLWWIFVRPELQYRAMFAKKEGWADEGDPGGVEYDFDGVGFAWDLIGMVSVGVVFGVPW